MRNFFSGIRGDQHAISREYGSPWGLGCGGKEGRALFYLTSHNYIFCLFDLILYVQANDFSIVFG